MTPRQVQLRRLVIAANRWPVLGQLMRLPYHAAVYAVARAVSRCPGASALCARNSFARNAWTPGLSDIDLTVIVRAGMDAEQEQHAAEEIIDAVNRLRRWFPMLGELELLNREHLAAFAPPGWRRNELLSWKLLWGEPLNIPTTDAEDDGMTRALRFYQYACLEGLTAKGPEVAMRVGNKLLRTAGSPLRVTAETDAFQIAATTILEFGRMARDLDRQPSGYDPVCHLTRQPAGVVEHSNVPPALNPQWHAFEGGFACHWSPDSPFLVLREGLSLDAAARAIAATHDAYRNPLILTKPALDWYLRNVDPVLPLALRQRQIVIGGNAPFRPVLFPSRQHFHRAMVAKAVDMFPDLYKPASANPDDTYNFVFGWVLRMLRYLEQGVIDFEYHTLEAYMAESGRSIGPMDSGARQFAELRRLLSAAASAAVSAQST